MRLIHKLFVVPEVHIAQFGVPVEPHGFYNESVELADQKISEIEGGNLVLRDLGKAVVALKKAIAMRPGDHLHAKFLTLRL